jgi:lipopolysaccharide transport system ATP-binding protein
MSGPAIVLDGLSKRYHVATARARRETLIEEVLGRLRGLVRRSDANEASEEFWALRDVSLVVQQGDVLGLVGRNGAGKSTLLKLLARITEPTAGRAEIYGRVGSLLEVGTGFDRELTGRENVFLSGAVLGMKRREIASKFDEIVAFAEVERFIDTPVKRYSSGMFLRLAFAVAAHLESEILLLDEVLAVGDAAFQKRCLGKMAEVAGAGRTIVFVSHNLAAIARFCTSCIWLDHGQVRDRGAAETVIGHYLSAGVVDAGEITFPDDEAAPGSEYIRLLAARVRDEAGEITSAPDGRRTFTVELEYRILRPSVGLRLGTGLISSNGTIVLESKDLDSFPHDIARAPGRYVSRCTFPKEFLNDGQYYFSVGSDTPMQQAHFRIDQALSIRVGETGVVAGHISDRRAGMLRMRLPWEMNAVP